MIIQHCRFEHGEEKAWDEYVYRSPSAGHCHLSAWRRVIEGTYGHQTFYLWAHENKEVKGILPLIFMRSFLFGKSLVSLPFLDDGGICTEDGPTRIDLYRSALRLVEDLRVDSVDLRHRQPSGLDLPFYQSKVTLKLQLTNDPDRMLKGFDAKLRNQIRKSQRSGLSASWTGSEGLGGFYDVFAANMRNLGSPVHSRGFFNAILKEFPDSTRLILVRKGNQTIGGGLCILFKDTILMPWASSQREYFSLCPNNLLYWEIIRWGCEKGYRSFDFGRSSPGSGTYHFKKQWGAIEEPLYWQHLSGNKRRSSTLQADDPKYRWITKAWKRLPLIITNWIGPVLRRQMSN